MGDSMISNKSEKESHKQVFFENLESKPVESQEHLSQEHIVQYQHIEESKEEKQEEGNDFDAFGDLAS